MGFAEACLAYQAFQAFLVVSIVHLAFLVEEPKVEPMVDSLPIAQQLLLQMDLQFIAMEEEQFAKVLPGLVPKDLQRDSIGEPIEEALATELEATMG